MEIKPPVTCTEDRERRIRVHIISCVVRVQSTYASNEDLGDYMTSCFVA